MTDALPGKLTFVSATSTKGSCAHNASSSTVTCTVGAMAVGENVVVTLTTRPKGGGNVDNTAGVSTSALDENSANNSSTVRIRLR